MKKVKFYRFVLAVAAVILSSFIFSSCELDVDSVNLNFTVEAVDVTLGEDAVFVIKVEDPGYDLRELEVEAFLLDKKTDYIKPLGVIPFYQGDQMYEKKCYLNVDENWETVIRVPDLPVNDYRFKFTITDHFFSKTVYADFSVREYIVPING